jgi:predicted O-methyltransferase YrrM
MEKQNILDEIKIKALENHVPILQDVSLEFILKKLEEVKPNKILEIGTAVGYSAINFSKYLVGKNSKIKTIEINENMYNIAIKNIKDMGLEPKIEVVLSDATKYLLEMDENKEQYDVVFIDAAKGQYMIFLENAIRLVKDGGIIIADNVLFKGRVMSDYNEHKHRTAVNRLRDYIKTIKEDERLNSEVYEIGDGVAVSIVNKNNKIN